MPGLTTPIIFLTNLKIYQQLKPARPGPLFSETCSFGSKISGQNIILQLVYCTRLSCLIAQSPTCDVSIHVSGVFVFFPGQFPFGVGLIYCNLLNDLVLPRNGVNNPKWGKIFCVCIYIYIIICELTCPWYVLHGENLGQ